MVESTEWYLVPYKSVPLAMAKFSSNSSLVFLIFIEFHSYLFSVSGGVTGSGPGFFFVDLACFICLGGLSVWRKSRIFG
jgi:hypothetical protein